MEELKKERSEELSQIAFINNSLEQMMEDQGIDFKNKNDDSFNSSLNSDAVMFAKEHIHEKKYPKKKSMRYNNEDSVTYSDESSLQSAFMDTDVKRVSVDSSSASKFIPNGQRSSMNHSDQSIK